MKYNNDENEIEMIEVNRNKFNAELKAKSNIMFENSDQQKTEKGKNKIRYSKKKRQYYRIISWLIIKMY